MEANGAVFLPAAGYRDGKVGGLGGCGDYWSSSVCGRYSASYLSFDRSDVSIENDYRNVGVSVRLVQDVK